MALAESLGLGYVFTGEDAGATATMKKVGREQEQLRKSTRELHAAQKRARDDMKAGAAAMAAGVGTLGLVNKATKAYGEFEFILASAAGKMADGAEHLKELRAAAFKAGKLTQFSPEEAAMGLAELGAQGLSAKESLRALMPVLNLAAGSMGQLGVGEAAGVAMSALNAFGKTVKDLPDVVDKLTVVSDSSAFQMRDFQTAIGQAAAQAKAGQQSFESMLATLGLLRDAGNEASSAATAYREAVRRVTGDERARRKITSLGVRTVDKQTGRFKDLTAIIAELHPRLQKLGVAERANALTVIFGVRGMKTYNAVISSYEKNLAKGTARTGQYTAGHQLLMDRMGKSHGAAAKKVKTALDTTGGQYRLLAGSWKNTVIKFGEVFSKIMLPVLKRLTDLLNDVVDAIDNMSPVTKKILSQTIVWGAALATVVGAYKVLRGAMALFTLGKLGGRYIAAQVAAAQATNATAVATATAGQQMTATTVMTSRFGRAMGFLARWANRALIIGAVGIAAIGAGKLIGDFLVKKIWGAREQALDANLKFAEFRLTLDRFTRTLKRGAGRLGRFRNELRANTDELIRAGSVSARAAEKVLGKMTESLGRLSIKRQQALQKLFKAVRDRNIKAATEAQKTIFEINEKMGALAEARLAIRAKQAERRIRFEQDRGKREALARTILLAQVHQQDLLEQRIAKRRKEIMAGVRAIADPEARQEAQLVAQKKLAAMQREINAGRMKVAKTAQRYGLLPAGAEGVAQLGALVKDLRPGLRAAGLVGQQSELFRTNILMAIQRGESFVTKAGALVKLERGPMTPARIRAMGEAREAALRARGVKPAEARAGRETLERQLRFRTVPIAAAPPGVEPELPRRETALEMMAMAGAIQQWESLSMGLGELLRGISAAAVNVNVNVEKGAESAVTVQEKEDARNGRRLRVKKRGAKGRSRSAPRW